jgi:hypothetical protein
VARPIAALVLALLVLSSAFLSATPLFQATALPSQITDQEFWRLVKEFSEEGGDYPYQNFVSNEITLQRIIPPTKRAIKADGVYIGVGPEQNFTYVSALKSKMAFDIRRQNILLHLMYKALFEMSPTRADFMVNLLRFRPFSFFPSGPPVSESGLASLFVYIMAPLNPRGIAIAARNRIAFRFLSNSRIAELRQ